MSYEQIAFAAKYGGTLFFFVFFLCVLVYVFWPGGGKRAKEAAGVLFQDDHPIVENTENEEQS